MKYKEGDVVSMSEMGASRWPSREGRAATIMRVHPYSPYPYEATYYDCSIAYRFTEEELELTPLFQGALQAGRTEELALSGNARILADDDKRESYPLYDGLFAYFPAALCEVARWSKVGNDKHNPGEALHWSREKSTDHENKILRHLLDADKEMDDGFVEATALAWRALALCQSILEKRGWAEGANGKWQL